MPDDQPSNGPHVPIGFMLAGSEMVAFTVIGLLLDYALGTMPWFTIVLTLLGLAAAFFALVRLSKTLTAKKQKDPPHGGTP